MERIVKNNRTRQCTLYVASTKYGGGVASSQKRVFVKNRIWVVGPTTTTTTTTTTTMYVVSLSRKQAAANYYIFIKYWNLSLSLSLSMSRYKLKLKGLFNKRPRLKHAWLSKRERERENAVLEKGPEIVRSSVHSHRLQWRRQKKLKQANYVFSLFSFTK